MEDQRHAKIDAVGRGFGLWLTSGKEDEEAKVAFSKSFLSEKDELPDVLRLKTVNGKELRNVPCGLVTRGSSIEYTGHNYEVTEETPFEPELEPPQQDNNPYKTPAPPTKKQKIASPGEILDNAGDTTEDILLAADIFCEKIIENMEFPSPLLTLPALGVFTNLELPHTQGKIDMRFSFGDAWPTTQVGEKLRDMLLKPSPCHAILVGKSGCGKTSAIFDAAQNEFCILFTASWDGNVGDSLVLQADPGGFDFSFSSLVGDVSKILTEKTISETDKQSQSNHRILGLIVARMVLLRTFRKNYPTATPQDWLQYQLTKDMHKNADAICRSLLRRDTAVLRTLKQTLGTEMKFFFAFDEAQYGYDLLKNISIWSSSNNVLERPGIACPLIRQLSAVKPLIIAGTAMRLMSIESCKSDLGKESSTVTIQDFPSVSLAEIKQKVGLLLNMRGVNYSYRKSSLWKLEGRGRLIGGFFGRLSAAVEDFPNVSKGDLLEQAIENHYTSVLEGLIKRVRGAFKLDDGEAQEILMSTTTKKRLPEALELLAAASLFGGTVSLAAEKINKDMLHVGLCSVRTVPGRKNEFVLDEELGRQAILSIAQSGEFVTNLFTKSVVLCREAGGHAMEPLIVAELQHWCETNSEATVREFLSTFQALPVNMPTWIDKAPFSVKGGYKKESYLSNNIEDDVEFIGKAIEDVSLRNHLLSPSTVKRPDFEAVMGADSASLWFLAVSSKLYSNTYNDMDSNDFRSTKPSMFYCRKDGSENKSCYKLRDRWEDSLKEKSGLFGRCLRIHVCLPEVKRPDENPDRLFIDEDDKSIVLYITSQNIQKVFRPAALDILRRMGCLQDDL